MPNTDSTEPADRPVTDFLEVTSTGEIALWLRELADKLTGLGDVPIARTHVSLSVLVIGRQDTAMERLAAVHMMARPLDLIPVRSSANPMWVRTRGPVDVHTWADAEEFAAYAQLPTEAEDAIALLRAIDSSSLCLYKPETIGLLLASGLIAETDRRPSDHRPRFRVTAAGREVPISPVEVRRARRLASGLFAGSAR